MGIGLDGSLQLIFDHVRTHNVENENALMLGKMDVSLSPMQLYIYSKRIGLKPKLLSDEIRVDSNGMIDSYDMFKILGFGSIHALDISVYEGADIVCDLGTEDLPVSLWNRFDYIYDGGTLEHVFNVPNALKNIVKMLKIGGVLNEYVAGNNYLNHGFYQISPELLANFYSSNGMNVTDIRIRGTRGRNFGRTFHRLDDCVQTAFDYRILNQRQLGVDSEDFPGYGVVTECRAVKVKELDKFVAPVQDYFYESDQFDMFIEAYCLENRKDSTIALWGAGHAGEVIIKKLKESKIFNMGCVAGVYDNNKTESIFCGLKILDIEQLDKTNIDTIIITSIMHEKDISDQIKGIKKDIRIIGTKQLFDMNICDYLVL